MNSIYGLFRAAIQGTYSFFNFVTGLFSRDLQIGQAERRAGPQEQQSDGPELLKRDSERSSKLEEKHARELKIIQEFIKRDPNAIFEDDSTSSEDDSEVQEDSEGSGDHNSNMPNKTDSAQESVFEQESGAEDEDGSWSAEDEDSSDWSSEDEGYRTLEEIMAEQRSHVSNIDPEEIWMNPDELKQECSPEEGFLAHVVAPEAVEKAKEESLLKRSVNKIEGMLDLIQQAIVKTEEGFYYENISNDKLNLLSKEFETGFLRTLDLISKDISSYSNAKEKFKQLIQSTHDFLVNLQSASIRGTQKDEGALNIQKPSIKATKDIHDDILEHFNKLLKDAEKSGIFKNPRDESVDVWFTNMMIKCKKLKSYSSSSNKTIEKEDDSLVLPAFLLSGEARKEALKQARKEARKARKAQREAKAEAEAAKARKQAEARKARREAEAKAKAEEARKQAEAAKAPKKAKIQIEMLPSVAIHKAYGRLKGLLKLTIEIKDLYLEQSTFDKDKKFKSLLEGLDFPFNHILKEMAADHSSHPEERKKLLELIKSMYFLILELEEAKDASYSAKVRSCLKSLVEDVERNSTSEHLLGNLENDRVYWLIKDALINPNLVRASGVPVNELLISDESENDE